MRKQFVTTKNSGQSLPIIALVILVLIGMVGLAVDVNNTYAQQRQVARASNAAAQAVMNYWVENPNATNEKLGEVAMDALTANGLDIVTAGDEPQSGQRRFYMFYAGKDGSPVGCGEYSSCPMHRPPPSDTTYIQVQLHGRVDTFFARLAGQESLPVASNVGVTSGPCEEGVYPVGVREELIDNLSAGTFKQPDEKFKWDSSVSGLSMNQWRDKKALTEGSDFVFLAWNPDADMTEMFRGTGSLEGSFKEASSDENVKNPGFLDPGDYVYTYEGSVNFSGLEGAFAKHVENRTLMTMPIISEEGGKVKIEALATFLPRAVEQENGDIVFDLVFMGQAEECTKILAALPDMTPVPTPSPTPTPPLDTPETVTPTPTPTDVPPTVPPKTPPPETPPTETPPTETPTPVPPTNTPGGPTDTPVPPTNTPGGPTDTPVPPTGTPTPVPPTNTPGGPTDTPVPPTDTPTPVPPTNTPVPPTDTPTPLPTSTPGGPPETPTNTPTNTPVPPTDTPTSVPPTNTPESPTNTPVPTDEPTPVPTDEPTPVPTVAPTATPTSSVPSVTGLVSYEPCDEECASEEEKKPIRYVVVMDTSGSMAQQNIEGQNCYNADGNGWDASSNSCKPDRVIDCTNLPVPHPVLDDDLYDCAFNAWPDKDTRRVTIMKKAIIDFIDNGVEDGDEMQLIWYSSDYDSTSSWLTQKSNMESAVLDAGKEGGDPFMLDLGGYTNSAQALMEASKLVDPDDEEYDYVVIFATDGVANYRARNMSSWTRWRLNGDCGSNDAVCNSTEPSEAGSPIGQTHYWGEEIRDTLGVPLYSFTMSKSGDTLAEAIGLSGMSTKAWQVSSNADIQGVFSAITREVIESQNCELVQKNATSSVTGFVDGTVTLTPVGTGKEIVVAVTPSSDGLTFNTDNIAAGEYVMKANIEVTGNDGVTRIYNMVMGDDGQYVASKTIEIVDGAQEVELKLGTAICAAEGPGSEDTHTDDPTDEPSDDPADDPTASCDLYPIAVHESSVSGVAVGASIGDIYNGGSPGNFGWLSWDGPVNVGTLETSLGIPGNSDTYVNPYNANDHKVSIGDWVEGSTGVMNSSGIRTNLTALKSIDIIVPVWNEIESQGSNSNYRVVNFAKVRITDYRLPSSNRITANFLGFATCE